MGNQRGGAAIRVAAIAAFVSCALLVGNVSQAEDLPDFKKLRAEMQGTLARMNAEMFYKPMDVAVDRSGNVFVAMAFSQQIVMISRSGRMSVLAGKAGEEGFVNGVGASARFKTPTGIAIDQAGNLYVSDSGNKQIRKITPRGRVTTVAVTAGDWLHRKGDGPQGNFVGASGIALDKAGNVYVSEFSGFSIGKVDAGGVATTVAGTPGVPGHGDGGGADARFFGAHGIAADGAGNVYLADSINCTIRKITPDGVVSTFAGTAGVHGHADGNGAAASFFLPYGLAVDGAGNLYVSDENNKTVRKITPAGAVTTLAGSAGAAGKADGVGAEARFGDPVGLAVDGAGNVYVADAGNESIRKIAPDGRVTTLAYLPSLNNRPGKNNGGQTH